MSFLKKSIFSASGLTTAKTLLSFMIIFFGAASFAQDASAQDPPCVSVNPQACVSSSCAAGSHGVAGFSCPSGKVCCTIDPPASCTGTGEICRSACQTGETSVNVCVSGLKCCVAGSTTASTPTSISFSNPLAFNTVEEVLGSLLGALQGIIVVLALVFIVIGAILYITSAGNDSRMSLAKGAITAAMIGLAIGIAAPSFLKEIGTILGWNGVNSGAAASAKTLTEIALNILQFLLSIVGVLGIIMLVVGGIMYMTAAGDEDRIDSGKKIVTYSIVGIAVALAALIIVTQIAALFV